MKKWFYQAPEESKRRSLALVLIIKTPLFLLFAFFFHSYWPSDRNLNFFFNVSGDTAGYYEPCEQFYLGHGYTSVCRMPGLLPIYFFIRLLVSAVWTKTAIIFLQFIADVIATFLLASIAYMLSNKAIAYWLVLMGYSLSYFVAVWNHVGYSDSFAVAMLVYAFYFALRYKQKMQLHLVFWSGFFMTWSVFFRPVHLLALPVFVLFFVRLQPSILQWSKQLLLFLASLLICLSIWTVYNYNKTGRMIVLQDNTSACSSSITPEMLAIRELIIAWGEDIQPWAKGAAAEWFFSKNKMANQDTEPLSEFLTSECTADSLLALKYNYQQYRAADSSDSLRQMHAGLVLMQSARFLDDYRKAHPFKAYFLNKIKLCARFIWPSRLDNLPLPSLEKMSFVQKVIKSGYFLLLLLVSTLGSLGCFYFLFKKQIWTLLPLLFVILLPGYFGYIEQRYFAPVYPFFMVFAVMASLGLIGGIKRRQSKIGVIA